MYSSYDDILEMVDNASKRFCRRNRIDAWDTIVRIISEEIDKFIECSEAKSIEVEVDDITHDIIIRVECELFEISKDDRWFFDLATRCKNIKMTSSDENLLNVQFTLKGVWKF